MNVITNKLNNFFKLIVANTVNSINYQKYLSIQLDITNSCNLTCNHCYHSNHLNAGALKLEEWINVLNQYEKLLKKLHLSPYFIICGGEPLISPLFKPLIKTINEKWNDVQITILTNGTIYKESDVKFLKDYNIYLQISLDGHNSQTHDEKRGVGTFKKTTDNIQKFISEKFDVHCLSILSKKTSAYIPEYFALAKDLKIKSMNFTRFIHQGFGEQLYNSGEDYPLSPYELKSAMELIIESSKKTDVKTNTDQPLYYLIDQKLGQPGLFGFQGIIVDYKGNLKVSSRINFKIGNILKEGLENLFLKDPLLNKLRSNQINGCGDCKFYSKCGGDRNASYASTGSFLNVDPGCWYYAEKIKFN